MSVGWSTGSMYSTTRELLRWERALFDGKVLSASSLMQMTTATKGNYGCGVFVSRKDDMEVVEHGGSIEGFNSYMISVPARNIVVIVLSNVSGDAPDKMAAKLLDVIQPRCTSGSPRAYRTDDRNLPVGTYFESVIYLFGRAWTTGLSAPADASNRRLAPTASRRRAPGPPIYRARPLSCRHRGTWQRRHCT